jgi:glycosyltransferase involved in cell wall biosynthesis
MISVIVPYVKDRGFLAQCLDSIRAQTYTDFELLECQSDGSLPVNFNNGLKRAKGEFIKMVQDDDWLPPDSLKHLAEGIGGAPWVVGNVMQMTAAPYMHKPPYLDFERQRDKYDLHMGSTMYRKDVLIDIGGMDETLLTGEEYDMHLDLLWQNYNPVYIDKHVYNYRMWAGGKSRIFRRTKTEWRKKELAKIKARYTSH